MSTQKTFLIGLIIVIFAAAGVYLTDNLISQMKPNTTPSDAVSIESQYENKIVYTTDSSADETAFQQDCQERGGEFQTCGTVCPQHAETCTQQCAYTCIIESENEEEGEGDNQQEKEISTQNWETYRNEELNFSIKYKTGFEITRRQDNVNLAKFVLTGPTQKPNTEIYDGIYLSIRKDEYQNADNLKQLVENRIQKTQQVGEITKNLEKNSFNGISGYKYTANTLGETQNIYLPLEGKQFISISYFAKDPKNVGFENILSEMLDSFEIIQEKDETSLNWTEFKDSEKGFSFRHPEKISVKKEEEQISLSHSVELKHSNPCDFKGDNSELEELTDFDVSLQISDKDMFQLMEEKEREGFLSEHKKGENQLEETEGFIEKISLDGLSGYKITQSNEYCGINKYYLRDGDKNTVFAERKIISQFQNPAFRKKLEDRLEKIENMPKIPEIIRPEEEQKIFQEIISSVSVK